MIYRVYSSHSIDESHILNAIESWNRDGIINIAVNDSDLKRDARRLPYIKDILDIGYSKCLNDNDIILYTNVDIGLIEDFEGFPNQNFFLVRKDVRDIRKYTKSDLQKMAHHPWLSSDSFGVTKKWYRENRDIIPDFIIGSPSWDIAFIFLTDGVRIDDVSFHTVHGEPKWGTNIRDSFHSYNKNLFYRLLSTKGYNVSNIEAEKGQFTKLPKELLRYFKEHKGFNYIHY